jgi:dihydroxyacetone kinase-like protein
MADTLTIPQVVDALTAACEAIVAAKDRLTKADQAIGDGDHGLGMSRGFTAGREALAAATPDTVGDAFKEVGSAILATSGGASGAIFGTCPPPRRPARPSVRDCRQPHARRPRRHLPARRRRRT